MNTYIYLGVTDKKAHRKNGHNLLAKYVFKELNKKKAIPKWLAAWEEVKLPFLGA